MKSVCVDLDGVLAEYHGWPGDVMDIGDPIPGAKSFLLAIRALGVKIIIWTTRTNTEINAPHSGLALATNVHDWLQQHDMPYDEIYTGNGKPLCSLFVDDRAVSCRPQVWRAGWAGYAEAYAQCTRLLNNEES